MFFDGSLMKTGAGAGLLFISPLWKHLRYMLRLHFPASNNVAEYEALVNGLWIAIELGVRRLDARGDSQLVTDQVMKNSHCRDPKMEAYCDEVRCLEDKFYGLELNRIARRYNETADELAKIASGRTTVPPDVFSRDLHQPSVKIDDTPKPEAPSALSEAPSAQSKAPSARPEAPSARPKAPSVQPEVPSAPEGEALRVEEERSGVQVVRLAGGWEGALPPQLLRCPPAMHPHRRRSGAPTRDTLGGLRPSHSTPSPCWKRLPTRFLLADGGGRRH
jgi:ribonuclease HI